MEIGISICRALTEGIIQHCITMYGWTTKSNIKKVNASINRCFRTATGILQAIPNDALRIEAKINDFDVILKKQSVKLLAKGLTNVDHGLFNQFWKYIDRDEIRHPCSLQQIIKYAKEIKIPLPAQGSITMEKNLSNAKLMINTSLNSIKKDGVNPNIFLQLYLREKANYNADITLFTDGSFSNSITTYAVVEQYNANYDIIQQALLTNHSGIFSAELAAIKYAVSYASEKRRKSLICTDSLSVAKSLEFDGENRKFVLGESLLHSEVIVLWIPGHIGIKGNELADAAAKNAMNFPLITEAPPLVSVIVNVHKHFQSEQKQQGWNSSDSFLKSHNSTTTRPPYHNHLSRKDCITIARTRVGTTRFSTQHFYERTQPRLCEKCAVELKIEHIFKVCPMSATNEPLEEILNCNDKTSATKIKKILRSANVLNEM